MQKIRAKAVCLFRHNGKILLAEGHDPIKDEHYVLPLGGGIDFGELSQAAAREV
ncbi:NUDIX domain-containing protein [Pectobacterium actinidiae]|uniref:NUDIX domain-containing protein n=1 Tax=Pectobacterium actinidiae TaxID=1507808 RepID=UPI0023AACDA9|nr:NUDIX domain-containing protein [Pectobacterium actinidiae]WEF10561.1 NUDIX domain-containing protein [Pectobacterium actinidiae]